jgi:hypothetical protein
MGWDLQRLHNICDARLANERASQLHLGHVLTVVQALNDCLHCIMAAEQGGIVRLWKRERTAWSGFNSF